MGVKGLIRDIIMVFVAAQLLLNNMDRFMLAGILIVTVIVFTIIGFMKFFGVLD